MVTHRLSRDPPTSVTVSPFRSTKYLINPFTRLTIEKPHRQSRRTSGLRRSNTMPAPVEIAPRPLVVRDIHDDEKLVLDEFERHTARCTQCTSALEGPKDELCEAGRLRAIDVTGYLYSKEGKLFSVVDKESGHPMRIKLPREANTVLNLLDAVEKGMDLKTPRRGRAPPVRPLSGSFDRTYHVPGRQPLIEHVRPRSYSPEEEPLERTRIIERSPKDSKRRTIIYQSPRTSPSRSPSSRGSLYSTDRQSRVERRYESTSVYRKSDYYT